VETRVWWPQLVSYWTNLAGELSLDVHLIVYILMFMYYISIHIGEQFMESTGTLRVAIHLCSYTKFAVCSFGFVYKAISWVLDTKISVLG
jgi:hypothetical protein